jgi:hypothetical protein
MTPDAPSAAELLANPVVQAALASAWADSVPNDPARRHEEGGWIYRALATTEIQVRRATPGGQASINLANPLELVGFVVVGKFHTHPNPTPEGWDPGPSFGDLRIDSIHGVPDLIQSDSGIFFSGPDRRRGGLGGNPGYPA